MNDDIFSISDNAAMQLLYLFNISFCFDYSEYCFYIIIVSNICIKCIL